jgi:hypothetical protein
MYLQTTMQKRQEKNMLPEASMTPEMPEISVDSVN